MGYTERQFGLRITADLDNRKPIEFPDLNSDDRGEAQAVEHDTAPTERSVARRIALQVLYEVDSAGHDADAVITTRLSEQAATRKAASYMRRIVKGVLDDRLRLDRLIRHYAPEWPLEQVAIIDRNILRIAMFELVLQPRAPVGVVIDEAVALARLYGADNSMGFVNGVLGTVSHDVERLGRQLMSTLEDTDQ